MKSILSILLCCLFPLFAHSQKLVFSNPDATTLNKHRVSTQNHVASVTSLRADQHIVGLYNSDEYDEHGLGLGTQTTILVGSEIQSAYYDGLSNMKVDGIRFALTESATINSIKLYEENGDQVCVVAEKRVNQTCKAGWTYIEFDEPYVVNDASKYLLPAYEITLSATAYPIAVHSGDDLRDMSFFCYGDLGQGEAWYNFGTDYGTPAIQLVCSADPIIGYNVAPMSYENQTVSCGASFSPTITINSTSGNEVSSIDYTAYIGGQLFTGTQNFQPAIPAGLAKKASFQIDLMAPTRAGNTPVVFSIDAVNGKKLDTPVSATFNQLVVTRIVPRYSIVEEFTGTGCGYCPLGWCGMEYVKKNHSDKAGVIAIHQYNNTDPMYGAYYHTPDFSGAPSCRIDRCDKELSPYAENMDEYLDTYNNILPEVDIKVHADFSSGSSNNIIATATTEFLTDLEGSQLVFVLTADGLTGTTTAWKQTNYLYQNASSQYPESAKDFCKGGKYAQSSVFLEFNDVMIGSSWPSAKDANMVNPFSTATAGEKVTTAYTLTLPSKTLLKNAIKRDMLYVTAFVLKADGTIANAARCKVGGEVIQGITLDQEKYLCAVGGSGRAIASTYPNNYETEEYEWTSSDPSVLFVDKSSGMFLGLKDGFSYITATLTSNPQHSATAIVLVGKGKEPVTCEDPVITVYNGKIRIQCETEGAAIHYDIVPSASKKSGTFSTDIDVDFSYTITAYATIEGGNGSNVVSKTISTSELMNNSGDVNADGEVTISDVTKLVDVLLIK